jgi:mRNA interferase HigB
MRAYKRGNTQRVMSKKALLDFIKRHPGARNASLTSYSLAQACLAYGYNDLKQTFASVVRAACTVFDAGGGRYRIVAAIHYNRQSLFVRHVLTQAEYDLWTRKNLNS